MGKKQLVVEKERLHTCRRHRFEYANVNNTYPTMIIKDKYLKKSYIINNNSVVMSRIPISNRFGDTIYITITTVLRSCIKQSFIIMSYVALSITEAILMEMVLLNQSNKTKY